MPRSLAMAMSLVVSHAPGFLIEPALRNRLFWLIDAVLLAACAYASLKYDIKPKGAGALLGSSLRLSLTVLLGVRVALRALAPLLNLFEQLDVRTLVAAL